MALTLKVDTDKQISLAEYVEYAERNVDVEDQGSILASAPMLRALANNKAFLAEFINRSLARWNEFQPESNYTAQTILLAQGKRFLVRANVWEPPPKGVDSRNNIFQYLVPHDHNFSFLTVGYLGSGYATSIFECDPDRVSGIPGDDVELQFLERTTLPPGKVMFYRAGADVHSQEHPEEFTISLNFMVVDNANTFREQYYFDTDNKKIVSVLGMPNGHRVFTCYLARFINDDRTPEYLDNLRRTHPAQRVRLTATESLAVLVPDQAGAIWKSALEDPHPLLQHASGNTLAALEAGRPPAMRAPGCAMTSKAVRRAMTWGALAFGALALAVRQGGTAIAGGRLFTGFALAGLLLFAARSAFTVQDVWRGRKPALRLAIPGVILFKVGFNLLAGPDRGPVTLLLMAAIELTLLVVVLVDLYRGGRAATGRPEDRVAASLSRMVPEPLARVAGMELVILFEAISAPFRRRSKAPAPDSFAYHEGASLRSVGVVMPLLFLIEALVVHHVVPSKLLWVQVLHTGVWLYSIFWVWGSYLLMRRRPHQIVGADLWLHRGLWGHARIPLADIQQAQPVDDAIRSKSDPTVAFLSVHGVPLFELTLASPVRPMGLLGPRPPVTRIVASANDAPRACAEILQARSRPVPELAAPTARADRFSGAVVSLEDVTKDYQLGATTVPALRGVSLDIHEGDFICVAGPSGSGKTTLLNLIGCVDKQTSGLVMVAGQETARLSDRQLTELRLRSIGFIFQSFNLIPVLSVFQNIELPLLLQGGLSARQRRERVGALIERVGLDAHVRHRPSELSGGQRQRVAIARALVTAPRIVLADEPTANLDSVTGNRIVDLMKELNQVERTTFILSTHDPRVVARASSTLQMVDGRLVSTPVPPELRMGGSPIQRAGA